MMLFGIFSFAALVHYANAPTKNEYEIGADKPLYDNKMSQEAKPTIAGLKEYLKSQLVLYGIGAKYALADETIQCESSWQINPKHNGISLGIAQFTRDTWHDFGVGAYEVIDPYLQLKVMAKMWSMGLEKRWDCYRNLVQR